MADVCGVPVMLPLTTPIPGSLLFAPPGTGFSATLPHRKYASGFVVGQKGHLMMLVCCTSFPIIYDVTANWLVLSLGAPGSGHLLTVHCTPAALCGWNTVDQ